MIKQSIQTAIFDAMKAKRNTEVKVLRYIMSQIKYEEINTQKELADEEVVALIGKEIKKRKEAMSMFAQGGRKDLVDDEEKQLTYLQQYLPEQLSDETLDGIIDTIISTNPNEANMGKIIGLAISQTRGKAESGRVAAKVKEKLAR